MSKLFDYQNRKYAHLATSPKDAGLVQWGQRSNLVQEYLPSGLGKEWFSFAQLSKLLKLPIATLREWEQYGMLKRINLTPRIKRVHKNELVRFLARARRVGQKWPCLKRGYLKARLGE